MATHIYIDQHIFAVRSDSTLLREDDKYQEIKDAINSRSNFLFGTTQWEEVYEKCTSLGIESGLDFLTTCYFTVASLKMTGLKGFADGLELMQACYIEELQSIENEELEQHRKKDTIEWVANKVTADLKVLSPTKEMLRDLYRSERALQELYELCEKYQSSQLPNVEAVAFVIFEHIDKVETQHFKPNVPPSQATFPSKPAPKPPRKSRWGLTFGLVSLCAVMGWGYWQYHSPNVWFYELFNLKQQQSGSELLTMLSQQIEHSVLQAGSAEKRLQQIDHAAVETMDNETQAKFKALTEKLAQYDAEQKTLLNNELERFYSARTSAANLLNKAKRIDLAQASALEGYILSLSPVYARLDYIEQLIRQGSYQEAEKELQVLDSRVSRIAWRMSQIQQEILHNGESLAEQSVKAN